MCTVTFIPSSTGFYLTSSRDEKASRKTILPHTYNIDGIDLIFPKDELAGGTWIASDTNGRTACLLNGAFVNHQKQKHYKKSRGLILLESFKNKNAIVFSDQTDLVNVEPFTLLMLDYSLGQLTSFYELKWDGEKKYLIKLNHHMNQIWSSATLYKPEIVKARKELFYEWVNKHQDLADKLIHNFHKQKHGLNESDDILMKGKDDLMTLSISQVYLKNREAFFNYFDIVNNANCKVELINNKVLNV